MIGRIGTGGANDPLESVLRVTARVLRSPAAKRGLAILLGLVVLFLWANMVRRALQGRSSQYDQFVDFSRNLVYENRNVYAEYTHSITKYPPFFGLLFAPLVPLPTVVGASIWFWLNLLLSVGAARLSTRVVRATGHAGPLPPALWALPLLLAAGIIGSNLETAQVNIFILFFLCLGLVEFRQGRDLWAGAWLGFVTALKLTSAVMLLYFAYKRSFRVLLGAALALAVCWGILPLFVLGADDYFAVTRAWFQDLIPYFAQGTIAEGVTGFRHTNQALGAVLHRFLTHTPAGGGRADLYVNVASLSYPAAATAVKLLSAAILALLAWICRAPTRERTSLALALEYSLVIIVTLFISPISWINHYVALLFPFTAGLQHVWAGPPGPQRRWMLCALVASFVLLSSSASRLAQALSLPFLGALILAIAFGVVLRRDQAIRRNQAI